MKILLADKQDITRAGLSYVISKIEGLETRTIEDKADLMLALSSMVRVSKPGPSKTRQT